MSSVFLSVVGSAAALAAVATVFSPSAFPALVLTVVVWLVVEDVS
jgi:hypothetical protein